MRTVTQQQRSRAISSGTLELKGPAKWLHFEARPPLLELQGALAPVASFELPQGFFPLRPSLRISRLDYGIRSNVSLIRFLEPYDSWRKGASQRMSARGTSRHLVRCSGMSGVGGRPEVTDRPSKRRD